MIRILILAVVCLFAQADVLQAQTRVVNMDIVIIDQPWMYNRLGATQPTGMVFALKSDVIKIDPGNASWVGNAQLRPDKRPRPIVLRANVGDRLNITLTNWLTPYDANGSVDRYGKPFTQKKLNAIYPATRAAGMTIMGMDAVSTTTDLGTLAGEQRNTGFVNPGQAINYNLIATEEGTFLLYSEGADLDNNGNNLVGSTTFRGGGAHLSNGLFGSINIQPATAEYYRSTVAWEDLYYATKHWVKEDGRGGTRVINKEDPLTVPEQVIDGYPVIDYVNAKYPVGHPRAGQYILRMLDDSNNLLYSDLTAIITGPNAGNFANDTNLASFNPVPASPDRFEAFREFSIHYHQAHYIVQAFPEFYKSLKTPTAAGGYDRWAINYGVAGIGPEIYANRIGVGPMADCVDCAYEEFFLSSWSVGDPALPVDIPANTGLNTGGALDVDETLRKNLNLAISTSANGVNVLNPAIDATKATKILYPDDPSNVYQSYMEDHVKFRIHHGSTGGVTHVHHQHAHQWLHSPNSPDGHYLDSQTINPGASYTLEMVYNGSGNRNQTVGDQIFHCHFYPHFAQGMWGLWRVLDVLEQGTPLDDNGRPVSGSRAYPDVEIKKGVPIPAIVPIPTKSMAPLPAEVYLDDDGQVVTPDTDRNPGFPFFIPGKSGSRPPHPPLDFARDTIWNYDGTPKMNGGDVVIGELDGGMPRHLVVDGDVLFENHTTTDWTKIFDNVTAIRLPEDGTPIEKAAMRAHATRHHATFEPKTGQPGSFTLNGLPPQHGAPYADPAIDDAGNPVGQKRLYKAANIQMDVVFNKAGWHYPQQRMITLWGDVANTLNGNRPPEPFFFRANSRTDFVEYWHTNLVPQYYEVDDFQVRTPTDILGQHIHLVKFDVLASDGAANGWNYEDGTFSPDQVRERIHAVSGKGTGVGLFDYQYEPNRTVGESLGRKLPDPQVQAPNPLWGPSPAGQDWYGAQTTIQRWYADPLMGTDGDRTLRTVFTHDHFGPSTHQQAGLYAGLIIEPEHTIWIDPVTGDQMGTRDDGGPTSWQALVEDTQDPSKSYREFCLEFQDLQLSYLAWSRFPSGKFNARKFTVPTPYPDYEDREFWDGDVFLDSLFRVAANQATNARNGGYIDPSTAMNPPNSQEIISAGSRGVYSVNYRNEPLPLRLAAEDATKENVNKTFAPSPTAGGDLANLFRSDVPRGNNGTGEFTKQPTVGSSIYNFGGTIGPSTYRYPKKALTPGMQPGDPYTPLLRAYQGDKIQVRTLVGAQLADHFFNIQGVNWFFEPSFTNSGYRSTQAMGISEHFEMNFRLGVSGGTTQTPWSDYVYMASSDLSGQLNGLWGLMRAYAVEQDSLLPLQINQPPSRLPTKDEACGCPAGANTVQFDVVATTVQDLNTKLVYYRSPTTSSNDIIDSLAMIYMSLEHYNEIQARIADGSSGPSEIDPLVLRAHPGDCIQVTLHNKWKSSDNVFKKAITTNTFGSGQPELTNWQYEWFPTQQAGFNVEKLSFNVRTSAGQNGGNNEVQTVGPGESKTYEWWAGRYDDGGTPIPVEFGTCVLSSPESLTGHSFGLYGAVIIEPTGSTWSPDEQYSTSATINCDGCSNTETFEEFVLNQQDNNNVGSIVSYNYKTQPLDLSPPDGFGTGSFNPLTNIDSSFSNARESGNLGQDPFTPVLRVRPGNPMRLRLAQSYGKGNGSIFVIHGHVWQEEPWVNHSTEIGHNHLSQNLGSRGQYGSQNSFEVVIPSAGGVNVVQGDFLYRSYLATQIYDGAWGLIRVGAALDEPTYTLTTVQDVDDDGNRDITGKVYVPEGVTLDKVEIFSQDRPNAPIAEADVDRSGNFTFSGSDLQDLNQTYRISSVEGGEVTFVPSVLFDIAKSVERSRPMLSPQAAPRTVQQQWEPAPGEKSGLMKVRIPKTPSDGSK